MLAAMLSCQGLCGLTEQKKEKPFGFSMKKILHIHLCSIIIITYVMNSFLIKPLPQKMHMLCAERAACL